MANQDIPLAGTFIIDDGGSVGSPTGLTWALAYVDWAAFITGQGGLVAGDVIIFGHNHSSTEGANLTIIGPAVTGLSAALVSCTQGTGSVAGGGFVYQRATAAQLTTSSQDLLLTNSISTYGMALKAGRDIEFDTNQAGIQRHFEPTWFLGNSDEVNLVDINGYIYIERAVVDDGVTSSSTGGRVFTVNGSCLITDMTFTNVTNRTGDIIFLSANNNLTIFRGIDFNGFTNTTVPVPFAPATLAGRVLVQGCLLETGMTAIKAAATYRDGYITVQNTGVSGNNPEQITQEDGQGSIDSSTAVVRTNGPTYEGVAASWLIETNSKVSIANPFCTPFLYEKVATGSQTLDVFLSHNTIALSSVDIGDTDVYLKVWFKATSGSGLWEVLQTDSVLDTDVSEVWTGSPTFRNRCRATYNPLTAGQLCFQLCVALASVEAADDFYMSPEGIVT